MQRFTVTTPRTITEAEATRRLAAAYRLLLDRAAKRGDVHDDTGATQGPSPGNGEGALLPTSPGR